MSDIIKLLASFLDQLLEATPGKELGEDIAEFSGFLTTVGLNKIISFEGGKILLDEGRLKTINLIDTLEKILKYMHEHEWSKTVIDKFADLFVAVYKESMSADKLATERWFAHMLRAHGGLLSGYGILKKLPDDVRISPIFKSLSPGAAHLFKEEKPNRGYAMLKEAANHGFRIGCITRLEPYRLVNNYGLKNLISIWVTFKKTNEISIQPNKLRELKLMLSEFDPGSVVLLDCFGEIKLVNGFEKAKNFLEEIIGLCKTNKLILLISIDPRSFTAEQLYTIEENLEVVVD